MKNFSQFLPQSQSQTQGSQRLGSLPYDENIPKTKFENKIRTELDNNDYFLKGFLAGYNREKERINGLRIKNEEKVRTDIEEMMATKRWRSEISEMIDKAVTSKLNEMKRTISYLNNDRMKLKTEIEELKLKLQEDTEMKRIDIIDKMSKKHTDKEEEI